VFYTHQLNWVNSQQSTTTTTTIKEKHQNKSTQTWLRA